MQSFADYEPIKFKFLGVTWRERLPLPSPFHWLHLARLRFKATFGLPVTYFDLRTSLTPEQQKNGDLWFLTISYSKRDRDAENTSRMRRVLYWITVFRYLPELSYVRGVFYSPEAPHHPDQPIIDDYLVRWGYLLDVPPSFIELLHGTDSDTALYAIEVLL
jgi:hypothetical protein